MALSNILRRLLANALMSGPQAKELADAVDASTSQATNATPTTITATNATVARLTVTNSATYANNANMAFNTTNGTMFGTAANQKIALWGATPIIQPSGTGELIGIIGFADNAANATNMNSNGNSGTKRYTFNDVVKALKTAGILQAS